MQGIVFEIYAVYIYAWSFTRVQLFVTPWIAACQASLSVGFSRQECVAISFSRGSFQPRDQTQVSCIAGRFFTICATI